MAAADIDLWPTLWAPLLVVLAVATLGLVGYVGRRFVKRLDDQDAALGLLRSGQTDMQVELAKQFGGNSGGLREAIDAGRKDFADHLKFHAEHPR